MDLFGMSGDTDGQFFGETPLPDIPEYSKGELTRMEREVTGLYLSGHPMDDYRQDVKKVNAVDIGEILADFSREEGNVRFKDDQKVRIAGVIETVKTKPTKNNSLMAYISLDDGSGSIELLAFQRVIDDAGGYMHPEALVLAYGRISARDDKEPQIVLETLRPISDVEQMIKPNKGTGNREWTPQDEEPFYNEHAQSTPGKTLYVKLSSENGSQYERLKLVHTMFPGSQQMIIHFEDTKKNVGAKCIIHEAFLEELNTMLGEKNVVVR